MQKTPQASRIHIAIFGRRNAGKSSLINALTDQDLAVTSQVPGTTTDPVYKNMELHPLGPVVMIDTAGIDDSGDLGEMKVKKTREVMRRTDLAVLVVDPKQGIDSYEKGLLKELVNRDIPVVGAVNKIDLFTEEEKLELSGLDDLQEAVDITFLEVSAEREINIEELKKEIIFAAPEEFEEPQIIGDLINPHDTILLVVPIDMAAPKGRLILPQVQTIRDILDNNALAVTAKENQLQTALQKLRNPPELVVTDSRVFGEVVEKVPVNIPLTGFSILFARYKGDLKVYTKGIKAIEKLKAGDKVLISEACTHHRTSEDIGTVKIPGWLNQMVGEEIKFEHVAGREFPESLDDYNLIVQCGGCMANNREILYRIKVAENLGIPITNYGILIARVQGILKRALEPFPKASQILKDDPYEDIL